MISVEVNLAPTQADEKIFIKDYIAHLKKHRSCYNYYSNFDRNFSPTGFQENLKSLREMELAGLKPFPVIHDYFMREIKFYLDSGYDFLALGGVMMKGSPKRSRTQYHIEYAMKIIPSDRVRVHLFGASSYRTIAHLELFSCDSSSWALNNKFGFILYWNPNKPGEDKTDKLFFVDKMKDYFRNDRLYWETYPFRSQLESYISSLGFTYRDMMGHESNHYRQLLNAIYYLTIEEIITKKQELKKLLAA